MKIYEASTAPNPRRVRIFLAEKGIDMNYVQVDIASGENLQAHMRAKNPTTKIPFLELDNGDCIGETVAICRYFEELYPDTPALMGRSPQEKAEIEMWHRRVEFHLMMPVGMCFQHTSGYFKDRMTPVAEYGVVSGQMALDFMAQLNERLETSTYIAGESFSIADICALCALDFARVVKLRIDDSQVHLKRWYDLVSKRESAGA
jgi:glutathione S-transferase